MTNYVKKVSTGGAAYYIKDVEARTVPILGDSPSSSTGTWTDADGEHEFFIGAKCRVPIEVEGVSTYKFYLLCNIIETKDDEGNVISKSYIWGESTGAADAPQVIYGDITTEFGAIPDCPAKGGTVTCPVPTYSQVLTITFNGQTFNETIVDGAEILYGISEDNITSETPPSFRGENLGSEIKPRKSLGTFWIKVTLNGKSTVISTVVYQEANDVVGVTSPVLTCSNFAEVEPLAGQTASQTVTGTCRRTYTSGATSSSDETGTVTITSVSSNNTSNFTASFSGSTVTVTSKSTNTSTSSTKTATITINGTVTLSGFTSSVVSCTATATQKKDYKTDATYGVPVLSGSLTYDTFSDLAGTQSPKSVPTYSQTVTDVYASGNTVAGSPITSGGTYTYTLTAATGFSLSNSSTGAITVTDNTGAARSTTVKVTVTLNGMTSSATSTTITQSKGTPYKAVDLGLPSGTIWCSTNVGADTETEYGEYFSWGDTIGKNKNGSGKYSFSESNYNDGNCGKGHTLSRDIPQGNATYDAARKNMGEPWKMFTKTQGQELINNTTSEWTTINGVNGRKFTSKTNKYKYIFLPAGGGWYNTNHRYVGSDGYYWSATWRSSSYTWEMGFNSGGVSWYDDDRYRGRSIRPIRNR